MPKPRVIVHRVVSLVPDQGSAQTKAAKGAVTTHLADGQTATLDPKNRDFAFHHQLLNRLHDAGLPAYLEVDPKTKTIQKIRLPLTGHVVGLRKDAKNNLAIRLDSSARIFRLPPGQAHFAAYVKLLHRAELDGTPVLITENDDNTEIIDIRPGPREPAPAAPLARIPQPPVLLGLRPVSPARAQQLFELVNSYSCNPTSIGRGCIPFLYPDDGCHGRASRMCQLILDAGETCAKVWNMGPDVDDPLTVHTRNSPNCQVSWGFHVATAMLVQRAPKLQPEIVAFDPALFSRPVPAEEWQKVQGPTNACLYYSDPTPLLPPAPQKVVPATPAAVQRILAHFSNLLMLRVHQFGPPPYKCPKQDVKAPAPRRKSTTKRHK